MIEVTYPNIRKLCSGVIRCLYLFTICMKAESLWRRVQYITSRYEVVISGRETMQFLHTFRIVLFLGERRAI